MFKNIVALVFAAATASASLYVRDTDSSSASKVAQAMAVIAGNGVSGNFTFVPVPGQTGLKVGINLSGLKQGTQYPFHIHVSLVPANGNCTATGGHLDTYGIKTANGTYNCDKTKPLTTCEIGDLAGIAGNLVANANGQATMTFNNPVITFGDNKTTILGHSIVVHNPDNSRLACGNIVGYVLKDPSSKSESESKSKSKSESDSESDTDTQSSGASSVAMSAALALVAAAIAF
ncbi:Cell surface superoxide dismutase [Cu-Zn] 4 [Coemansia sp. S610]|nr:Superoxide dismutase [Coemansia sp. RSA 2675]KAJ2028672.1 Cell surface superoxide dismutase [Cu-Zn] 4 [Coemansia sp. S610]KAJ2375766.1 Superoxide dismutase [Coemansia sp. RSA 2611]KAJ2411658.1 Superoxide dismutase [Coemansia sp. RSA 2530]KAJ2701328.1 Cell surface superoxide dismutase [Cu-Zn] 4 [Coemansia sp. IMI 209128]